MSCSLTHNFLIDLLVLQASFQRVLKTSSIDPLPPPQMMSKNIILLFVATFLSYGCATLQTKVDPFVGEWEYEIRNLPQGEPNGVLTVTKTKDGYAGIMGTNNLNDFAIEGNEIVSGDFQAQGYRVELTGRFEGDVFTGQINAASMDFPMTGMRK